MTKGSTKVVPGGKPNETIAGYKVLGTTKDGVRILKPKGRTSTRFSERDIRDAIMSVRAAKQPDEQ